MSEQIVVKTKCDFPEYAVVLAKLAEDGAMLLEGLDKDPSVWKLELSRIAVEAAKSFNEVAGATGERIIILPEDVIAGNVTAFNAAGYVEYIFGTTIRGNRTHDEMVRYESLFCYGLTQYFTGSSALSKDSSVKRKWLESIWLTTEIHSLRTHSRALFDRYNSSPAQIRVDVMRSMLVRLMEYMGRHDIPNLDDIVKRAVIVAVDYHNADIDVDTNCGRLLVSNLSFSTLMAECDVITTFNAWVNCAILMHGPDETAELLEELETAMLNELHDHDDKHIIKEYHYMKIAVLREEFSEK